MKVLEAAKCGNPCPECGTICQKKVAHAAAGFQGIAGDCWCEVCHGWWIAGETTLLRNRS